MIVVRDWKDLPQPPQRTVLTIGNFDGVHRGHQELFRQVVAKARAIDGTAVVYTFCPHPLKVLRPQIAPQLITTLAEKEALLRAAGIDLMICLPFDQAMANMSAETFVREVLVDRLGLTHLVVGEDYAFGRGREGTVAFLQACAPRYGFTVEAIAPVADAQANYSSTRIRQMVQAGQMEQVAELLGRPYGLTGTVIHGDKRGRTLGFPTANLATAKELLPAAGVYAVRVQVGGDSYPGVAHVGGKPTFGAMDRGVEVHLLGFDGVLYGQKIRVQFATRLRGETTFPSAEALAAAIRGDVARAQEFLRDWHPEPSEEDWS